MKKNAIWLMVPAIVLPLTAQAAALNFSPPAAAQLSKTDPSSLTVADFDGDTRMDIAIAMSGLSGGDGAVSVLLSNGAGGFTNHDFVTGAFNPWGIASGDFNGDGRPDLAVTATHDSTGAPLRNVNIYLGNGAGLFVMNGTIQTTEDSPQAVLSGDFNGDKLVDLLVGATSSTSFHSGDGKGGFSAAQAVSDARFLNASDLVAADFNNDGRLDFASSSAVFVGTATGFTRKASLGGGSVAAGDLNNDSVVDVVSVIANTLQVQFGVGDGTFKFGAAHNFSASLNDVTLAHLNNDSLLDVVTVARDANQLIVLFGSATGALSAPMFFSAGAQPALVAVGDWNLDVLPDIVAPSRNFGETPFAALLLQRTDGMAAVDDTFSVVQGSAGNILNVLANDLVPAASGVLIASTSDPNHGGTVAPNVAKNGLTYSPAPAFAGTEVFSYTINDTAGAQSAAQVGVTVTGGNSAPVAVADIFQVNAGSANNVLTVLTNDSDPNGDPLTIQSVGAPNQGGVVTANATNGTLVYTPVATFVGTESFSYTIRDPAGLEATALVTVTVNAENRAPVAFADTYEVLAGSTNTTLAVLVNDTDPEGDPLTIQSVGVPSQGGTVVIDSVNKILRYTPAATFVGTESFSYTIRDPAGLEATALVTVTVKAVNRAPVAVADTYDVLAGSANSTLTVLVNDSDPDGDPLTIQSVGVPSQGGTVVIDSINNVLTYTPATQFAGTETFSYTIRDSAGLEATAVVTVTVKAAAPPANRPPVAMPDTYTVRAGDANNRLPVLDNDSDPDGNNTITLVSLGTPNQGGTVTIDTVNNVLMYSPVAGFIGAETFEYTIKDAANAQASSKVTVIVKRMASSVNPVVDDSKKKGVEVR